MNVPSPPVGEGRGEGQDDFRTPSPILSFKGKEPLQEETMGKTALFLMITVIAIPALAIYYGSPLTEAQLAMAEILAWEMVGFSLLSFIVSEVTRNYSQTDKLWSLTPIVFCWTAAHLGGYEPRMVLVSVLVTIWGARLTYNFGRMGGYSWKFWEGHQDYRWDHVREMTPALKKPLLWTLFNLFFISFYQHGLLMLIALPIVTLHGTGEPGVWDAVLAALFLGLVIWETIADQQQWNFQTEKHRRINAGETLTAPYDKGFTHTGLWARSRHPNYFAEQSIWVVVFGFSLLATGSLNWTVVGCVLLIVLFRNSSELAETISSGKYPAYEVYKQRVNRFLPRMSAASLD